MIDLPLEDLAPAERQIAEAAFAAIPSMPKEQGELVAKLIGLLSTRAMMCAMAAQQLAYQPKG